MELESELAASSVMVGVLFLRAGAWRVWGMRDRGPWLKLPRRQLGGVGVSWNEREAGE